MRPSSGWARVASGFLPGLIVAGLPGAAGAQSGPPAATVRGAASPGTYRLGVFIEPVAQWNGQGWVPLGLRITGVSPGSPAERAGIQAGNVLTTVNGSRVISPQDLLTALANSGGRAALVLYDGRGYTARQVPSFAWAAPVARVIPMAPSAYSAPAYSGSGWRPAPRQVIRRPFYSNYGDAPSPNPFSTPPSYGDVVR